ncbi:MAG: LamG-like jellyroll fold domain-containing protein [Verrucomicrobiota bacterium]
MSLKRTAVLLATAQLMLTSAQAKLAAWFPLNETSGSSAAVAEVIAGANGFTINPDFITQGRTSFHGHDGAYLLQKGSGLDIGGTEAVQPTDQFTISFWFQPSAFNANGRLVETQVGGADTQNGLRIDLGAAPGNHIRALLRDGKGKNTQLTHSQVLKTDGSWYFVALRYDSTKGDGTALKVSVVEAREQEITAAAIIAATQTATALGTGPLQYPHARSSTLIGLETEAGNAANLNAVVNDLAFYDNSDGKGVLTDDGLAASYNYGPGGAKLINAFTSATSNVAAGGNAALSWNVNPPLDSLTLQKGDDAVLTDLLPLTTGGSGTLSLPQSATTTYTLRAAGGGAVSLSAVKVVTGLPVIAFLKPSLPLIQSGGSTVLYWQAEGADSLTLNPGNITVTGQTQLAVSPTSNTPYTLTAANAAGSSTATVLVRATTAPLPSNSYYAGQDGNDESLWRDNAGPKNWPLTGLLRNLPLVRASAVTGINGSYQSPDSFSPGGITLPSFQYAEATIELWIRPDTAALTPDHQLIFESGGGQNGTAVLINDTGLRFLGSAANVRTLDVTVPTAGLELNDFIQVIYTISGSGQKVNITVRDVTGQVQTATATGKVVIGTNAASLLALAGAQVDLGGRTELADASPAGLTGFAGEIAILNLYNRVLTDEENAGTFKAVLPVTPSLISSFETNLTKLPASGTATLSWKVAGTVDSLTLTDVTAGTAPVNVLPATTAGSGTFAAKPTVPTTYTLRASRAGTVHSASVSVYAGTPSITSFTAAGTALIAGESTTLSWNVTGADTVVLSPAGVEAGSPNVQTVTPAATTTYTLTATNIAGSSTAEVTVNVKPEATPAHHYAAASEGNDEFTWIDEVNGRNWPLNGVTRNTPLAIASGFGGIKGSYQTADSVSATGVTATSFQYTDFTVELWVRPDLTALNEGHQILFENGGGQNGSSVLLTQSGVRFLGSSGNVRTLDVVLPTAGLNLGDFIQIVYTVKGSQNQETFYVRDVTGKVVTATASVKVSQGANVGGLFHVTGSANNLGGRTDLADVTPEGLTGFAGEIALLNIYDRALTEAAVTRAYETVATTPTTPPVGTKPEVTSASYDASTNRITLEWNSTTTGWYQAEISSDLTEWEELGDPFQPATAGAATAFQFPAGPKYFIRIRTVPAP